MKITNPFRSPVGSILDSIMKERVIRRETEVRYQKMVEAYRDLLNDPRYEPIRNELYMVISEQIELLIDEALTGKPVKIRAEKISFLRDIVRTPIREILAANLDEDSVLSDE